MSQEEVLPENSIQNCPEEPPIPWFQVHRKLIRDPSLSLECKGFLTYLASHSEKFNISIPWIIKTQRISKNIIYRVINEAIENGYLQRESFLDKGKKRYRYLFSMTARFKKSLLYPDFQDTEKQDPENQDRKLDQSPPEKELDKSLYKYKEKKSAPPPPSASAEGLFEIFLSKIKERNPKFKDPNKKVWVEDFDKLLRLDKRDLDECKEIVEWASQHSFWKANCLSPATFRKSYDKMLMQMDADENQKRIDANRRFAMSLKNQYPDRVKNLTLNAKYAMNLAKGKELPFDLPRDTFRNALCEMFGGRYESNRQE